MTLNGIDVSNVNGAVDWEAWRGKIAFAGIKVSEGLNFTDQYAAANVRGARSIGVAVMGYHFLRANLPGIGQARYFLDRAGAAGIGPGDLVMVDVETMDGMSAAQVSDCAAAFAGEVRALARAWPVAYTMQSFALGGCTAALGVCPAFIANPSRVVLPVPVGPWRLVSFEQTGQRGIDTDVFHGDAQQLAALAVPRPAPPADWVFTSVRGLTALPGHTSVLLSWSSPGTPEPAAVHHYQVTVRKDGGDVPSYPRDVAKASNPQTWQGGSLEPGTTYEALVRAMTADGSHASPWAAVTFTTGHA
jgi:GH25 family lysozyme M1 (1,4-beta-N-acetylmuramidase)